MIKTDAVVRIDLPEIAVVPATIQALILAYRGLGTHAEDIVQEQKESQDDLKTFLAWVEANGIKDDDAVIEIVRVEEEPEILRLSSKYNDFLYMQVDTHEDEGQIYEYIKSITTWKPGKETVRPEGHLMIAPPMYLNEPCFLAFMLRSGWSKTDGEWLLDMVKKAIDDYPISHGADRPRLYASRLFNISRNDTPLKSHFPSQDGVLYADIMVADKGSWSRAARLRIATGWKDTGDGNWAEKIVRVERPATDEPEQHAMSAKAGVYQYLNIGEESPGEIYAAEPELRDALKNHLTVAASKNLTDFYQLLTSPSNPDTIPGKIGYRLHRYHGPNLAGMPNPIGMVRLELFTGERFVGAVILDTVFMKPLTELTLMDGLVRVDYVEMIDNVRLDADTDARMQQPRRGWTPQGSGWGGLGGQRWGGGPMSGQGAPFAQHHAWGPALQMPFMEEAKLSAFNLGSYNRVLTALVENIPLAQPLVRDVVDRMSQVRDQTNPQTHGQLMYQFEFNSMHGLLMRVISQSGVVLLQQVIPTTMLAQQYAPRW
jgi:hypothetical protein